MCFFINYFLFAYDFGYILYDQLSSLVMWHKTASSPSEIISNRVCAIWLGIGEGSNVINKQVNHSIR